MGWKKAAVLFCVSALLVSGCTKQNEQENESETAADETAEPEEVHEPTSEEKAETVLAQMSTADKAGQLVTMAVRTWNGAYFTEMNEEVQGMFSKHRFGGICLFEENFTADTAQTVRLTQAFQSAVTSAGGIPMFISADQEGGSIHRLVSGAVTPGNMALAASGDPLNAYKAAEILGSELSVCGVNTDFAPVADVNSNPANPVIGIRSFSDDPSMVYEYAKEYVKGLHESGVTAALKHFPGHGDTDTDSHTGLPRIEKTKAELASSDLIPFQKMVKDGYADMLMSAHIQFPDIEQKTYTSIYDGTQISLPATLSKTILTDIVRNELGFKGVIITDAMLMDAIAVHFDPLDAAALALNAGADIILMPVYVYGSETIADTDRYMSGLIEMIENGTVPMERVDEACRRILTLKYERGIMDAQYSEAQTSEMIRTAAETVGSPVHREAEISLSDEAVTVVENNGILPLRIEGEMRIVIAGINEGQTNALTYAYHRLEKEGYIPAFTDVSFINANWTNDYGLVYDALAGTDVLILSDHMYSCVLIDPSVDDQIPNVQAMIREAHAQGIRVITINTSLPYDLPLLSESDALMAVYNPYGITEHDGEYNPTAAYGPNLISAMNIIFGKSSPKGRLPVNIPEIENGRFTQNIAYSRGEGLTW